MRFRPWGINGGTLQYVRPAAIAVTIEYSCPGRIRDTELAMTARVAPRAEEEGVKSRSGRIGERVGSIHVKRADISIGTYRGQSDRKAEAL